MMNRTILYFALALLLVPEVARAQSTAAISSARETAKSGIEDYYAGQFESAHSKLSRAFAVVRVPTLALFDARALVQLGKFVEAAEAYLVAMRLPIGDGDATMQERARRDAKAERAKLLVRIPRLTIEVIGVPTERVTVTANGTKVEPSLFTEGWMVNPGAVKVVGIVDEQRVETVELFEESTKKRVTLTFPPPSGTKRGDGAKPETIQTRSAPETPTSNSFRTATWVSLGIGATGVVFGATMGGWAFVKKNRLDENDACEKRTCIGLETDVARYNLLRRLSSVGFIVGAAGGLTGAVLYFNEPRASGVRRGLFVSPWIGVAEAGVSGSF